LFLPLGCNGRSIAPEKCRQGFCCYHTLSTKPAKAQETRRGGQHGTNTFEPPSGPEKQIEVKRKIFVQKIGDSSNDHEGDLSPLRFDG
jgi:hypothetical protein